MRPHRAALLCQTARATASYTMAARPHQCAACLYSTFQRASLVHSCQHATAAVRRKCGQSGHASKLLLPCAAMHEVHVPRPHALSAAAGSAAGAPVVGNATYVMCGPGGKWCYWHQGTGATKDYPNAKKHCENLGGELVWWVALLLPYHGYSSTCS